jgi:hypothetical protein
MPSGVASTLSVCGACYTAIFNVRADRPSTILLRAGTLDESESIVPIVHIFTKRKQAWVTLPRDVPAFEEFPSRAEFYRLLEQT